MTAIVSSCSIDGFQFILSPSQNPRELPPRRQENINLRHHSASWIRCWPGFGVSVQTGQTLKRHPNFSVSMIKWRCLVRSRSAITIASCSLGRHDPCLRKPRNLCSQGLKVPRNLCSSVAACAELLIMSVWSLLLSQTRPRAVRVQT
jgi:hypothetical protein